MTKRIATNKSMVLSQGPFRHTR